MIYNFKTNYFKIYYFELKPEMLYIFTRNIILHNLNIYKCLHTKAKCIKKIFVHQNRLNITLKHSQFRSGVLFYT